MKFIEDIFLEHGKASVSNFKVWQVFEIYNNLYLKRVLRHFF
jgi:hypothetical protein